MVLKLPLTRAASTKGLHRYKGLLPGVGLLGLDGCGGMDPLLSNVWPVGVGERLGPRGFLCIDRPMELRNDIALSCQARTDEKE